MTEVTPIERERLGQQMTEAARRTRPAAGAEVNDRAAYWYLITCAIDCDAKAARWLVRRRFGIFQPIMARRDRYGDNRADGSTRMVIKREPAFPGYLFVMAWDIGKMYDRLIACPGVEGVLSQFGEPWPIQDSFIKELYALDWIEDSSVAGDYVAVTGRRNRKRRPRNSHKISNRQTRRSAELVKKDLVCAGNLVPSERISLLLKALPLSPSGSGKAA